jgi:lactoylglutathione lyase
MILFNSAACQFRFCRQSLAEDKFMKIDHIAIWTNNLERLKEFYARYFNARCGDKYINSKRSFESYFLQFDSGARIELMRLPTLLNSEDSGSPFVGYAHVAISVGEKESVDEITFRLKSDGYTLLNGPRYTGDGYYESVVLDPDGNQLEITI